MGYDDEIARGQVGPNRLLVHLPVNGIGKHKAYDLAPLRGFRQRTNGKAVVFRPLDAPAPRAESDTDIASAIAQVEGVRAALTAVSQHGDTPAAEPRSIANQKNPSPVWLVS